MSRQQTFSNIIHIRDFVDTITDDPGRGNPTNYVLIQTDINIFQEDSFYSPNVVVEPIRTRIHAYMTQEERDQYLPNSFFYADGRFSTTLSTDSILEISVQTLSLMRHPGDVAGFDQYRRHLPEQWCPMVTVIGSVHSRSENVPDSSEPRHFTLETSAYDASKTAPVQFSVACFLENTRRWQKVKTPPPGAFLSVTAKIAGRTADANLLALRVLDLAYLPRPPLAVTTPTPTATPSSKRSSRWEGRATPSTPSKRPRLSETASQTANPLKRDTTTPEPAQAEQSVPRPEDPTESPTIPPSPSTTIYLEESPPTSALSLTSESEPRPHRNRHPPRKYADLE